MFTRKMKRDKISMEIQGCNDMIDYYIALCEEGWENADYKMADMYQRFVDHAYKHLQEVEEKLSKIIDEKYGCYEIEVYEY